MIIMMTIIDYDKGDEQKAQRSKNNQVNQEQVKSLRIKKNSRLKKKV